MKQSQTATLLTSTRIDARAVDIALFRSQPEIIDRRKTVTQPEPWMLVRTLVAFPNLMILLRHTFVYVWHGPPLRFSVLN